MAASHRPARPHATRRPRRSVGPDSASLESTGSVCRRGLLSGEESRDEYTFEPTVLIPTSRRYGNRTGRRGDSQPSSSWLILREFEASHGRHRLRRKG